MAHEKAHGFFGILRVIIWIILLLIAMVFLFNVLCNKKEYVSNTSVTQTTDNVETLRITVPVGRWVHVDIPKNHDWKQTRDPAYGDQNTRTLVYVMVNGNQNDIRKIGMLPDGTWAEAYFQNVEYVSYMSAEDKPAYFLISFIKKTR